MDKKINKKPVKVVMVRRGGITTTNVPTQKLLTFIEKKALLGTDEISSDGKNWVRIDRHYQLRKFFPEKIEENIPKVNRSEHTGELEVSEIPADIKNKFKQVADLLNEING